MCCQLRHVLFPILTSPLSGGGGGGDGGGLIVGEDVREFHLEAVPFVININNNLQAGQRERLLLFDMSSPALYFTVLLNENADLSIAKYVTLTDIQNRELVSVPGTACGGLEVALCELTYYHRWLNISAEFENGIFDGRTVLGIPKGYYNVCEVDKEAFWPLGAEISLHAPTGRLQISSKKKKKTKKKKKKKKNAWCSIAGWPTS